MLKRCKWCRNNNISFLKDVNVFDNSYPIQTKQSLHKINNLKLQ